MSSCTATASWISKVYSLPTELKPFSCLVLTLLFFLLYRKLYRVTNEPHMQSLELHKVNAASQCKRSLTAFLFTKKLYLVGAIQGSPAYTKKVCMYAPMKIFSSPGRALIEAYRFTAPTLYYNVRAFAFSQFLIFLHITAHCSR